MLYRVIEAPAYQDCLVTSADPHALCPCSIHCPARAAFVSNSDLLKLEDSQVSLLGVSYICLHRMISTPWWRRSNSWED